MRSEQIHQNMVEQIATILAYVKRIDKKLDTIMGDSVPLNRNNENNFVSLLPITTVEALKNIETKLLDATFEKQMISNIFKTTFITQLLTSIKYIFRSILLPKLVVLMFITSQKEYLQEFLPMN